MSSARIVNLARQPSSDDFRGAMRRLVGAVSVVTVGRAGDITGMTVTSVSSLSLDPPSVIVSVNRASSSWPRLKRYRHFGVNILNADQLDIAERFAGKDGLTSAERFAGPRGRRVHRFWSGPWPRSIARSRTSSSATPMRS